MGFGKSLVKGIEDHKQKIAGPHFLFSAQAPKYPEKNVVNMGHDQVLSHLKGAGFDAHAVDGHYGGPEKSIAVYGVNHEQATALHGLASRLGQDSSIYSTGNEHEMSFHHGDDKGKKITGKGTVWHAQKPDDFYTSLPGGVGHFTHNFDFDQKPDNSAAHASHDNVAKLPLAHPPAEKKKMVKSEDNSYTFRKMLKAEDPEAYRKLASKGIMVGYPVTINGEHQRPDNGIHYHSTVKFFDPEKDKPQDIHNIASKLGLQPPKAEETGISHDTFKDRMGNDVHVIKLHGKDADKIKEHNSKFSHMGHPTHFEYSPHISVDKATWDKTKASGAKTAAEAGIQFHPAELKQGPKTLANYNNVVKFPDKKQAPPKKMAASEPSMNSMQKGAVKNVATAVGAMAAVAGASPAAIAPHHTPSAHEQLSDGYNSKDMLNAISQVESSNGKNTKHDKMIGGLHSGESAYGKYGLMPQTIRETIGMNRDLQAKHGKASALKGDALHRYMHDNPQLEDAVASKHLSRLEHHFGHDKSAIAHAWLNGIAGTHKAMHTPDSVKNHWYARKVSDAYKGSNNAN